MEGEKWEQKNLLLRARDGDEEAVKLLVQNNLGLVHSVVKKFSNSLYDSEDLFQIGSMGLLKAIRKFDLSYDVRFSTYAVPMIIGEIKRFLRDDGPVKVSRSAKELAIKARTVSEMIQKQTGVEPSVNELASILGQSGENIAYALEASAVPESLYVTASEQNTNSLIDKMPSKSMGETEIVDKIALREMIYQLKARERQIIVFRYFKDKTQSEVAQMLGISQVQVSRLEKKILCQLKEKMSV
ncbi:MAG: SigB/SigF/SigG family RNA polymerase sigma factor [Ruminococcaceae bacterium]|nr:SigB/SigF/SigG family RNA polymerase sigma factor [Oscillospiraceae bacterium]